MAEPKEITDEKNGNVEDDNMMWAFAINKDTGKEGALVRVAKPSNLRPGFARIRVLRAGICNTDLELLQGYMGFSGVLGHEFVGVVESAHSEEEQNWIGARVCGDINVGCFACGVCNNENGLDNRCPNMSRNHCPHRSVLGILNHNGTMAEYLTLPLSNLHRVPPEMTDEVAVFAEPLAAACRIVEQNLIHYNNKDASSSARPDRVAILGDGKLGLMIAEVLGREHMKHFGRLKNNNGEEDGGPFPRPILFGKYQHKLDFVADSGVDGRFVDECKDASAFNGVAAKHSQKYDVVVDATGNPAGLSLAAGLCRPMGILVLKSTCAAGEQFNAAPFVIDELRVVGSRCGPIDKALELLSITNSTNDDDAFIIPPLNVEKYITKCFPLSEAPKAMLCAAEKSTMKVQIICSEL